MQDLAVEPLCHPRRSSPLISTDVKTERRRTEVDLTIIGICSIVPLALYMAFNSQIASLTKNPEAHILTRLLSMAVFQFGTAGLGITIVSLFRRESFIKHGLTSANLPRAIILSALATLPHLAYRAGTGTLTGYMPFRQVHFTSEILASGFPVNVIGMAVVATAWGFFEGFNYAFIHDKINELFPPRGVWLNWGAIACGVFCLLIHGMVGVTPDALIEAVTVFTIIYGMLIVKEHTGNAWGTVFVFLFFWNAI
jgi:hypothetical protein